MPCPQCGTETVPGAKFCSECAAPLTGACPTCGTANPPQAKFCSQCATPLAEAAVAPRPQTPAAAPVAERRLVTVLFADLVGFTPFAEERDAEDVRETLSRYFELSRETVERYGGTVEKFIGDAVMAVWGTPTAREDDAERAVRAALDLVADVRGLGETMQARAGVLTGEAAVTIGAVDQGMVAGDIVNTAARLQGVAEPGTVLVGESTRQAALAAIAFEEAGDAVLKGKASPVPAYRALRVVAERGGRNRSGTLEAPFVGREEELRQLKDQYHTVTREGRPRLVSIMGPAGIGKSRLSWEFLKYIDGVLEPVWWHSGRSPAYGEGITFWALGEMIRTRAGLAETDDEEATRAGITAMLAEHVPDEDERRWIEPAMLTLLGIGDQQGGSEEHFAAWRTFFERMAETAPVALVIEDLHWADSGLLDFIDHVLEWTRDRPIYIVTLARPELLEKRPTWGAGKRQFTSIFLEPLPEDAMRDLLTGLVPGLPERALRAIVERADGVPLYAVETVRMLVAEGRLTEEGGAYVPAGNLEELAVPDTLTALIASRLDALDPSDRTLLQDASVLGQSFTPDALAAVSQASSENLEQRLRQLARRELLVLRADPRAPDRGQYAFVQSLIREVAYHTLARADRKARHLAAARYFEGLPTDELAGALAGHYLAAHENAGAGNEADALAAQARIALKGAADRAAALGAWGQAHRYLRQALSVTTSDAERADLYMRAGDAAARSGDHADANEHFRAAGELHIGLGNEELAVTAAMMTARNLIDAYDTESASAVLRDALERHAGMAGNPAHVALEGQMARLLFFQDEMAESIKVADRVLDHAEHHNLTDVLADTLITKGSALSGLGRSREGLMLVVGGAEVAEAAGQSATVLRAAINRGFSEGLDSQRTGLESARTGIALARRLGLRSLLTILTGNAAEYAVATGEWDWAERELAALGDDLEPSHRSIIVAGQAFFASARGRDAATPLLNETREIAEALGDPSTVGQHLFTRAMHRLVHGQLRQAQQDFDASAETVVATSSDSRVHATRAAAWMGDRDSLAARLLAMDEAGEFGRSIEAVRASLRGALMALEGRADEAATLFRQARRAFSDLELPWLEALSAMDALYTLPVDHPEWDEARAAGRAVFETLGAAPLIAQIEAIETRGSAPAATDAVSKAAAADAVTSEVV
jgi:class 3 adenylate cyclase/predicted negative regulator of RcsB-dependent stress response